MPNKKGIQAIFLAMVMIMSFAILGCQGGEIMKRHVIELSNGFPVPGHQKSWHHFETDIKATAHAVRRVETSQDSVCPQYLSLDQKSIIKADGTVEVALELLIENPSRNHFRIKKIVEMTDGKSPQVAENEIYDTKKDGLTERKFWQLKGPIDLFGKDIFVRVEILNENGEKILALGNLHYLLRPAKRR